MSDQPPAPAEPSSPPPAVSPPEPPAPRSRRTLRITLIVLAVTLLAGGVGGFLLFGGGPGPAGTVAEDYLAAVRAGDYATTYRLSCEKERGSKGRADRERVAQLSKMTGHKVIKEDVMHDDGLDFATVTLRVTWEREKATEPRLYLIKEEGEWRVCR